MPQESLWYWLVLIIYPLLGLWYLISNMRARAISGYPFCGIAALWQSIPLKRERHNDLQS